MTTTTNDAGVLHSDRLQKLYAYWNAKRGSRSMPARRDIEPLEIHRLLPHVVLVDVEASPMRFRYRLVGTFVTQVTGRDVTGCYVDSAIFPHSIESVLDPYRLAAEHQEPVGKVGEACWVPAREWMHLETLILPLSADGVKTDMLLLGIDQVQSGPAATQSAAVRRLHVRTFLSPRFATA